jgi:hypothetical protein
MMVVCRERRATRDSILREGCSSRIVGVQCTVRGCAPRGSREQRALQVIAAVSRHRATEFAAGPCPAAPLLGPPPVPVHASVFGLLHRRSRVRVLLLPLTRRQTACVPVCPASSFAAAMKKAVGLRRAGAAARPRAAAHAPQWRPSAGRVFCAPGAPPLGGAARWADAGANSDAGAAVAAGAQPAMPPNPYAPRVSARVCAQRGVTPGRRRYWRCRLRQAYLRRGGCRLQQHAALRVVSPSAFPARPAPFVRRYATTPTTSRRGATRWRTGGRRRASTSRWARTPRSRRCSRRGSRATCRPSSPPPAPTRCSSGPWA